MRATLLKVMVALLVVVGPACGSDDDDEGTATSLAPAEESTTTTMPASDLTTTTAAPTLGDEPPFRDGAASGSGCTPGDTLSDGWWYGTIAGPPTEGSVSFDLACYYVGTAAEEVAASRGDEVTNDYYVVNDNDTVRALTVAAGATATCVDLGAELTMVDCAPPDVDGEWAVWLRVQGAVVDRIVEQYAP